MKLKWIGFRILAVVIPLIMTASAVEAVSAILLHFVRHQVELPPELLDKLVESDFPDTVSDPYQLFRIRPQQKRDHYSSNSLGLRGEEFRPEGAQLTVLLLGGSVAWSYLVRSDREALSAELSRVLSRKLQSLNHSAWKSAIVLNAGVPAYVSRQAAIYYARSLRTLGAQLVVSLDGVNDVNAALNTTAGGPLFWNGGSDSFRRNHQALSTSIPRWIRYRLERSKFNRLVQILNPAPLADYGAPTPAEVAAAYFDTLYYLSTLTAADGARFVPVLQPVCVFGQNKPLTSFEKRLAQVHEEEIPGRNLYFAQSFQEMRDVFPRLSETFGHVFPLDAGTAFQSETEHCFADCYHLTPRGISRLADYLGEHLLKLLSELEPGS